MFCSWSYNALNRREEYKVIWADERSAVVLFGSGAKQSCHHLFFDGIHFYFVAGHAGNAEYFRKVRPNNRMERPREP